MSNHRSKCPRCQTNLRRYRVRPWMICCPSASCTWEGTFIDPDELGRQAAELGAKLVAWEERADRLDVALEKIIDICPTGAHGIGPNDPRRALVKIEGLAERARTEFDESLTVRAERRSRSDRRSGTRRVRT